MTDVAGLCARVFLLSPANLNGTRGTRVISPKTHSDVALRLRSQKGIPLGELYSFVSGLYFLGKLSYARRFARPPDPTNVVTGGGVHIITPNAGLRTPETHVTAAAIYSFSQEDIDPHNDGYRAPLERSAAMLAQEIGDCDVVLLGSIASPKYVDVLLGVFGDRLRFPIDFVGRGDMSRGGLLLRRVADGVELPYTPVAGAVRRGVRPPKLGPLCRDLG